MIDQSARRAHNQMDAALQAANLAVNGLASIDGQRAHPLVMANLVELLCRLDSQLPGGSQHQRLHFMDALHDLFHRRDTEGSRLASTRLSLPHHIMAFQHQGYSPCLDGRRLLKAHVGNGVEHLAAEFDISE